MKKTILITLMYLGIAACGGCSNDKEETTKPETLSKQELPTNTKNELTREQQKTEDLKNALESATEEFKTGTTRK